MINEEDFFYDIDRKTIDWRLNRWLDIVSSCTGLSDVSLKGNIYGDFRVTITKNGRDWSVFIYNSQIKEDARHLFRGVIARYSLSLFDFMADDAQEREGL